MSTHTALSLGTEKWGNFTRLFASELIAINVNTDKVTWEHDVMPKLVTALILCKNMGLKLLPMIETRDADMLLGYIDLEDAERGKVARAAYKQLSEERQDLLWRYIKFFLELTIESISD